MPTTQLQLGAWGGRRYGSFAGKNTSAPVYGGRFVAGHVYRPGMQKAIVANVGFAAGDVYQPGFQRAGANQ